MNALFLGAFQQIAYLLQAGVPEWNTETDYHSNGYCRGADGALYVSLANDNLGNDVSDTNWWRPYLPTPPAAKSMARAWVVFNGESGTAILDAYLITTVTRLSTGVYRVFAPTGVSFVNACIVGNSGGDPQHHNDYISLEGIPTSGYVDIRNDSGNGGDQPFDNPYISLMIF